MCVFVCVVFGAINEFVYVGLIVAMVMASILTNAHVHLINLIVVKCVIYC